MLKLNRSFASAFVAEDELVSYMDEHADVLARCQAGEGRHAGSLGWLLRGRPAAHSPHIPLSPRRRGRRQKARRFMSPPRN